MPRARFTCPEIQDNPDGWGPFSVPEQYKDVPYQPFSKSDRLGKAADFTGNSYQGRSNRFASQFESSQAYGYFHEEDESSFQLVDTQKDTKPFQRGRKWQSRTNRRDLHRARDDRRLAGAQLQGKGAKNRERDRARAEKKMQRKWAGRRARFQDHREPIKKRDSSVQIESSWEVLDELEINRLGKLSLKVDEPRDLVTAGELEFYDKSYDRVSVKAERPLQPCDRTFHKVTTTDDDIIRNLSTQTDATVFATDAILATLMTCPRSVYSWDVVVERVGAKLFFDKRDDSDFDHLTVDETAFDPPQDEGDSPNTPENLAVEATYVNGAFSQQCLRREPVYKLDNPNPFAGEHEEVASVGYRYRQWDLGGGISMVARCEHDAVTKSKSSDEVEFLSIKTLNEWNPTSSMSWRRKLDSQRGAVLATALKDNACKLAKWTVSALLAGSSMLRLGYVSRVTASDSQHHVVLGTQAFKPLEFATQITLQPENCWGILRHIIDMLMKYDEGKYIIVKDPMKPLLRFYKVPADAFDNDSDDDDDDDEDDPEESVGVRTDGDFLGVGQ